MKPNNSVRTRQTIGSHRVLGHALRLKLGELFCVHSGFQQQHAECNHTRERFLGGVRGRKSRSEIANIRGGGIESRREFSAASYTHASVS